MVATPTAPRRRPSLPRIALLALVVSAAALAAIASTATAAKLKGSIALTTGSNSSPYTGSWVRLYQTANPAAYFINPSSPAADQSYTPLVNGTQGVELNTAQPLASPPFDGGGNSLTNTILTPEPFAGVNFSAYVTVNPTKKAKFGKKGLILEVGKDKNATDAITAADFTGWTIAWGGDSKFATPGSTANVDGGNLTGTITWTNPSKHNLGGKIALNWSAQINEPPFQAYTAVWQLQGTYTP
jgi:hypothetical protein